MIRLTTFANRRLAVFGLGLSGRATVEALLAGGAEVAAWDDSSAGREAAEAAGIALTNLDNADWSAFDALVLAPGVPLTHPEPHWTVRRAAARSLGEITSREAIDALIRPDVEQARRLQERGNGRARLIAEIYLEPSALVKPLVEQHFRPVAARFMPHMSRAAPHVDPTTLSWRVRWLVFPMLGALALDEDAMFALDEHELVDRIVTASAAALAAETGAS